MTAIIDYGVGNLFSLKSSLKFIGEKALITGDAEAILKAERVILPGVGAFGAAARKLSESDLDKLVMELAESGKPLLGICVGMQLLFQCSYEYGKTQGLGLLQGEVKHISSIASAEYKAPHIGWNALNFSERGRVSPLHKYTNEGDHVYFVHSYAATGCGDSLIAGVEYGNELTAAVARKNIFGVQFHPEKSGDVGLKILKAFCEIG